jgi:hypothetical protein
MLLQAFEFLVPLVLLVLVVAAAVFWGRTRRAPVLLQLMALSLAFFLQLVEFLASQLMKFGKSALYDITITESWRAVSQIGFFMILLTFPAGYLWYALTRERI